MIYVKDSIQCNEIHWLNCKELECIGLNIILSPQMSFILVVIYRPPSSNIGFYEKFEKLLKECNFSKEVIIMGDFNINWEDKSSRKNLKQITDNFDLMQLISGPTRITKFTRTQIDLIFSNRPERKLRKTKHFASLRNRVVKKLRKAKADFFRS